MSIMGSKNSMNTNNLAHPIYYTCTKIDARMPQCGGWEAHQNNSVKSLNWIVFVCNKK